MPRDRSLDSINRPSDRHMQVSRARYILVITYSNQWRILLITNSEFDFLATIVDIPHFSEYILDVQFNILLFIPSMHDISSTTKPKILLAVDEQARGSHRK